ncbi:MAG: hypothetical protein KatS3mg114_0874 [Planctomycetaceae bacterium]|nr:MAG: hypothetical protein KatS3mg114_0874 [Planctomycetaceae bacterium]
MRNVIFGGIGVLWGGGILLYSLLGGDPRAGGAYGAGQAAATIFGLLMFAAGLYYLITGIRGMSRGGPTRRPRGRKPRPIGDDDE